MLFSNFLCCMALSQKNCVFNVPETMRNVRMMVCKLNLNWLKILRKRRHYCISVMLCNWALIEVWFCRMNSMNSRFTLSTNSMLISSFPKRVGIISTRQDAFTETSSTQSTNLPSWTDNQARQPPLNFPFFCLQLWWSFVFLVTVVTLHGLLTPFSCFCTCTLASLAMAPASWLFNLQAGLDKLQVGCEESCKFAICK